MSGQEESPGNDGRNLGNMRSLGRRRQGAFQDFMARHLILSTTAALPVKLRLVCEAGEAITWGTSPEEARIEELFKTMGAQNLAIESALKWFDEERTVWSIRWLPETISDDRKYEDYFKDWDAREGFEAFETLQLADRRVNNSQAALGRLTPRVAFLVRTSCLTEKGFAGLKAVFYQAAQEPVMKLYGEIAKRIDPTVFERALRSAKGEL